MALPSLTRAFTDAIPKVSLTRAVTDAIPNPKDLFLGAFPLLHMLEMLSSSKGGKSVRSSLKQTSIPSVSTIPTVPTAQGSPTRTRPGFLSAGEAYETKGGKILIVPEGYVYNIKAKQLARIEITGMLTFVSTKDKGGVWGKTLFKNYQVVLYKKLDNIVTELKDFTPLNIGEPEKESEAGTTLQPVEEKKDEEGVGWSLFFARFLSRIIKFFKDIFKMVTAFIAKLWTKIRGWGTKILQKVKNFFKKIFPAIITKFIQKVKTKILSFRNMILDKINALKNKLAQAIKSIKDLAQAALKSIKTFGATAASLTGGLFKKIPGAGFVAGAGAAAASWAMRENRALVKSTVNIGSKIAQSIAKHIPIGLGKALGKAVPVVGAAIGLGLGIWELMKGNYVGAGLEVVGGVGSVVTAIPAAIASIGNDVYKDVYGNYPVNDNEASKLAGTSVAARLADIVTNVKNEAVIWLKEKGAISDEMAKKLGVGEPVKDTGEKGHYPKSNVVAVGGVGGEFDTGTGQPEPVAEPPPTPKTKIPQQEPIQTRGGELGSSSYDDEASSESKNSGQSVVIINNTKNSKMAILKIPDPSFIPPPSYNYNPCLSP